MSIEGELHARVKSIACNEGVNCQKLDGYVRKLRLPGEEDLCHI
jgi:hypothetical protein